MSIKDIIKKSFIEGFTSNIPSLRLMLLCLVCALLIGVYIYCVYRLCSRDSFYSPEFNLSLIMISVITCAIILTIQSSVIVSLGMVGALSIVRFRTAVKSSIDLVFLFWAISIGIISGTGLIGLAVLVSFILSVLIVIFKMIPKPSKNCYYVSVDSNSSESLDEIVKCIKEHDAHYTVLSQNLSGGNLTITAQIHTLNSGDVLKGLSKLKNVKSVNVIAHGENTGI